MFEVKYDSIQEIHKAYKEKRLKVRELVLAYLSRIAKIDKCDGGLNSVLEINPDALFIADMLDERLRNNEEITPLFGIPILLKDNINTADRLHTGAGSVALADNYAPYDAHIVNLLRQSGAIILGKTNMTEFAAYMTLGIENDCMPNGYSSRGGQTLNPYDKSAIPSGSSTGSAVAVSANLCAVAVGTETSGSIISPSQVNGIVGIKPTLGLLSRHGVIPISNTLDTPGAMARSVADAAILLGAMSGKDERDLATSSSKKIDYTQYLDKKGLNGAHIGISGAFLENADKEKTEILENIIPILKKHGAECVKLPANSLKAIHHILAIMRYEFKCGINNYLSSLNQLNMPKNLQEIILYNQRHSKEALKYGQSRLIDVQNNTSGTLTEPTYIEAIVEREEIIRELDNIFLENEIDVIFSLSGEILLPALTGFPSMTIPVGMTKNNLPLGSCWIARRFDEATLLKITYAAEQAIGICLRPKFEI